MRRDFAFLGFYENLVLSFWQFKDPLIEIIIIVPLAQKFTSKMQILMLFSVVFVVM